MPRYHFHVEADDFLIDVEGMVLPDDRAAQAEASRLTQETIENPADRFREGRPWKLRVVDDTRRHLVTLELSSGDGVWSMPTSFQASAR